MADKVAVVKTSLWIVVFGLLITAVYLSWQQQHIVIKSQNIDCRWQSDSFILKWRHSVEKQYWQEYYQQQGDQLHLYQTFMQSFGAGVPSAGKSIPAPKGYVGLSSDVLLPQLNWVVSRNMQGQIIDTDKAFAIYQKVPNYTEVQIAIEKKPRWFWLCKETCL